MRCGQAHSPKNLQQFRLSLFTRQNGNIRILGGSGNTVCNCREATNNKIFNARGVERPEQREISF